MNIQELLEKQWVLNRIKETAHRITLQLVDSFEKYPWLKEKIFEISDGDSFVHKVNLYDLHKKVHEQIFEIIEKEKSNIILHTSESVYEELLELLDFEESEDLIYDLVSDLEMQFSKENYKTTTHSWSDRDTRHDKIHITSTEWSIRLSSEEMLEGMLFNFCESLSNKEWERYKKHNLFFTDFKGIEWYSYIFENIEDDLVRQIEEFSDFSEMEQIRFVPLNKEKFSIYKNDDFEEFTENIYKETKENWFNLLQDYEVFLEISKEEKQLEKLCDSYMLNLLEHFEDESLINWYESYIRQ